MDLLQNKTIQKSLRSIDSYDIGICNQRYDVLHYLDKNPTENIEKLFNQILREETTYLGYYQIKHWIVCALMNDPDIVVKLFIDVVEQKINSIFCAINEHQKKINLSEYIQIWKCEESFFKKIRTIIRVYCCELAKYKLDKKNKSIQSILSLIHYTMFYNRIIAQNQDKISLDEISDGITDQINKQNINLLIDYIKSIDDLQKNVIDHSPDQYKNIISKILNNAVVIDQACMHQHILIKKHDETFYENNHKNDILKIASILGYYGDPKLVMLHYQKYMQTRIVESDVNIEFEYKVLQLISMKFNTKDRERLINSIRDIQITQKYTPAIQNAVVDMKSEKYKNIGVITPKILNPLFLMRNNWSIQQSNVKPNYPLELNAYLDICEKSYQQIKNNYEINWQANLGFVEFTANFSDRKVKIKSNMLQAIALSYFNTYGKMTSDLFSKVSNIDISLANKIIESLYNAGLIILSKDNTSFVPNRNNYVGERFVDLRKYFIDAFVKDEDKPLIVLSNKDTIASSNKDTIVSSNEDTNENNDFDESSEDYVSSEDEYDFE